MSTKTRAELRSELEQAARELETEEISVETYDERKADILEEALDAPDEPKRSEPAYTIVGTHDEGGQPWGVTVFTHNGPEAALDLAHAAYAEEVNAHSGERDAPELQVTAILAGEAKLIDFDNPETWT